MKKGLILEGGAMRGLFTAGVMDVLMEHGVAFDGMIGVSAGAAFGCNYKSGQIGRVLRYNTRFCADPRYCGLRSLRRTGDLYNADFCYGEVPMKLDRFDCAAFERSPMAFWVVCTDVETGKAVYHEVQALDDHGFDWMRASASMPLAARIVEIEGKKLLDGGIADSIPVRFFEKIGYERNVVVLTQPLGYRKQENRAMPLIRRAYREYPQLMWAMQRRHVIYNWTLDEIARQEAEGRLLVLRPDAPLPVGRVEKNPDKLRAAHAAGVAVARRRLAEVEAFLQG